MHVIIFIYVIAKGIVLRNTDTRLSVLSLCVIFAAILSLVRLHTNVLTKELICAEIVHEVLTVDESTLFVGVLQQNLVESLYHSLHDFFEAEMHSLFIFIESTDIFSELLIDFFDHSVQPVPYVGVCQLNLFVHLSRFLVKFLTCLDLDVKLVDLGVSRAIHFNFDIVLCVGVLHLQLLQLFCDSFVLPS